MVEDDSLGAAREICLAADRRGVELLLPTDVVVADSFSESAAHRATGVGSIPPGWMIMDIGPETAAAYAAAVEGAGTVVWNGTMGVSEWPPFSHGTERVAHALAGLVDAVTVLGGGSTAEAVQAMGLVDAMTHVSTGGGASLEFLEGRTLPGRGGADAMIDFPDDIFQPNPSKIVLLVVDGLGGMPHPGTGMSELETASLPNLDRLAQRSAAGLSRPVAPGVTPGSGPGHTALFGYDPLKYTVGRGVLEALGIGVELAGGDVAVRGNFCTVDESGAVVDRRAGRIPTSESAPLAAILDEIELPGVELAVHPGKDYRFVLIMRGDGLGADVRDTEPRPPSLSPSPAEALSPGSEATAAAANAFALEAGRRLAGRDRANMVLLRGFSQAPSWPQMGDVYKLDPAAIAAYPMYRGLAQILGMQVIPTGETFDGELATLESSFGDHDFFFLHYKPADAAGEDANFDAKVAALEELDRRIPRLLDLDIDTLVVAGDHSTPAVLGRHSWHPVPLLIHARHTLGEGVESFTERACRAGSIGSVPASAVMMLALANADKLTRFGP